ncbi:MAG: PAS domain S-box protein [Deltaproteobacteria bacterium]|nr:PAS domain S-box protein [Deltaproteobacteria bacterium]
MRHRTTLIRYAVAAGSVAAATALRLAFDPILGTRFPFATLFFAVLVSAWLAGFGPALAASLLGALLAPWFLLAPRGRLFVTDTEDVGGMLLYLAVSLGIAAIGGAMHRARTRAEAAARDNALHREQLRVTLRSIGDAVVTTDMHGRVTSMNEVASTLTGWPEHEARGRPLEEIFRIVNELTRAATPNPALEALRVGRIVGLANHTMLIARDGQERPIDDSAAPIRDDDGRVHGAVLIFRDVSDRRRGDEVRALLAAVVESSDDAIVTKDLTGTVTSWNAGARALFGYTAEEMVGQSILKIVPPERAADVTKILAAIGRGDRIEHFESERVRRDGTRLTVSLSVSPIRDASGRITGASKIARDITDQKRAEREKDHFLAMLGHELRNPLSAIRNALTASTLDPSRLPRALELASHAATHLTRLVDDLLDVTRVTQGRLTLRRAPLRLADVVERAAEGVRPLFEERGVRLELTPPHADCCVDGDATRLEQVVGNLLTNAAKYTEAGGRVTVSIAEDDGAVVLRVRDTGMGMSRELLPRIFTLFVQGEQALDRARGGLGIGLTLVKKLVDLHGGTVEAHSEGPGQGAEFVVRLPRVSADSVPARCATPAARFGNGTRVLIVEDNSDAAESLTLLLEALGLRVRAVGDGPAALAAAHGDPPDVMLVDIGLPGMSGYEVAERVRQDPALRDTVLVALTGYGLEEDRRRAIAAGFDQHLVKPVEVDKMRALLAQLDER